MNEPAVSAAEIALFARRVREAAAWCNPCAANWQGEETLRSAALRPASTLVEANGLRSRLPAAASERETWQLLVNRERKSLVEGMCTARSRSMPQIAQELSDSPAHTTKFEGPFVAFWPDSTLSDGGAELSSDYYFDIHNEPPWDAWLWFESDERRSDGVPERAWRNRGLDRWQTLDRWYRNYLIALAPESILREVGNGMTNNAEGCIIWLDDLDTPLTRALRRAGLLPPYLPGEGPAPEQ